MQVKAIKWKDAKYGFEHGYVGKVHIFTVGWDSTRARGEPGRFAVTTNLPLTSRETAETLKDAKIAASRMLQRFAELIVASADPPAP